MQAKIIHTARMSILPNILTLMDLLEKSDKIFMITTFVNLL